MVYSLRRRKNLKPLPIVVSKFLSELSRIIYRIKEFLLIYPSNHFLNTTQKNEVLYYGKCDRIREEIVNGKLHFLYSGNASIDFLR